MKNKTYKYLLESIKDNPSYFCLIDPDKVEVNQAQELACLYEENGADCILIGGSMMLNDRFCEAIKEIKIKCTIPVIIFPGIFNFVSPDADALLLLNMVSSRNPQVLINEQVRSAPLIYKSKLETIPTAYMLIESGCMSSVQYMSHSLPIPRKKADIAIVHALAAQYLGMKIVYLEAGSGAEKQVPSEMIMKVREHIDIPIIVGGGIRKPECAEEKARAGADFIVTGTVLEDLKNPCLVKEFAQAVHNVIRNTDDRYS